MNGAQRDVVAHEYDGIEEYDNPTPGWWHLIFIVTIFFSLFYYTFWHFSPIAWTNEQAWAEHKAAQTRRIFGAMGELNDDEPTLFKLMGDAKFMAVAQGIFQTNCASCHAKDGGGINGVNLTDDSYKNVTMMTDIFNVITKGAANGAMPTWENRLSNNERVLMAAYVASLRGTKPGVPKGPEGKPIPAWPSPGAAK